LVALGSGGSSRRPDRQNGDVLASTPRSRSAVTALAALIVTLLATAAFLSAGARAATVTVSSTPESSAMGSGFLGISTKYGSLEKFTGTNASDVNPAFLNLLGDIAPGQRPVLRLGGESADFSWYSGVGGTQPAWDQYTITPNLLKVAAATAQGMHGQLIMDLNLEAADKTYTLEEARAMLKYIGASNILAMEIGNEPELYHHFAWYHTPGGARILGRPANWSPPAYRAQFADFADGLPKGVTIAGPTSGLGDWLDQLGTFLHDEPKVGLVTMHAYPLKHCSASHRVTIPDVLSNSTSDGYVNEVAPFVRTAQAYHRPIRIDEMNAITCGGTRGVSDSFATALWMMQTLFGLDKIGDGGINVNVPAGTINAILNPVTVHGHTEFQVQPEYYAMMMFAQAAPPGSRVLKLGFSSPPTLESWATRQSNGTIHVVLINKSASASEATAVRVSGAVGPAALEELHARGLASTDDVSLGGQTFGAQTGTGLLSGTAQRPIVAPVSGAYNVTVPAAGIEMLTLTPQPGALLMSALRGHGLLSSLLPSW
jgi:hypothetical protein